MKSALNEEIESATETDDIRIAEECHVLRKKSLSGSQEGQQGGLPVRDVFMFLKALLCLIFLFLPNVGRESFTRKDIMVAVLALTMLHETKLPV